MSKKKCKIYTIFKNTDQEFKGNLKQISKYFNINITTLKYRLNKNLNYLSEKFDNEIYEFSEKNQNFKCTRKQFSEYIEMKYYDEIKYTSIIITAIEMSIKLKPYNHIVFKNTDKQFIGSLPEIAKKFNCSYSILKTQIDKGLTIEEAIEIPLKNICQNNITYKDQKGTMKELCKIFNKDYIEVYNKVKYNHTFEWAMDSTDKSYEE